MQMVINIYIYILYMYIYIYIVAVDIYVTLGSGARGTNAPHLSTFARNILGGATELRGKLKIKLG